METAQGTVSVGIVSLAAAALTEPQAGLPIGGSELQLHLLGQRLAREDDLRPVLYVADVGQPVKEVDGLRVEPLIPFGPGGAIALSEGVRAMQRLRAARCGVYVTRSASGINGLVSLAARRAGGRHLHMIGHDSECRGRSDAMLSFAARRLHRWALARADCIVCQTRAQQQMLRDALHVDALLSPNFPPPPGGDAEGPRAGVLWVGRDVTWKRPEAFVELARALPGQSFTMICQPQPGRDLDRIRASAPDNLALIPGLRYDEAARLFPAHRVFVLTSTEEGFPNVVLQASAAGTPIVSLGFDPDGLLAATGAGIAVANFDALREAVARLTGDDSAWAAAHAGAPRLAAHAAQGSDRVVAAIRALATRAARMPSPCAG